MEPAEEESLTLEEEEEIIRQNLKDPNIPEEIKEAYRNSRKQILNYKAVREVEKRDPEDVLDDDDITDPLTEYSDDFPSLPLLPPSDDDFKSELNAKIKNLGQSTNDININGTMFRVIIHPMKLKTDPHSNALYIYDEFQLTMRYLPEEIDYLVLIIVRDMSMYEIKSTYKKKGDRRTQQIQQYKLKPEFKIDDDIFNFEKYSTYIFSKIIINHWLRMKGLRKNSITNIGTTLKYYKNDSLVEIPRVEYKDATPAEKAYYNDVIPQTYINLSNNPLRNFKIWIPRRELNDIALIPRFLSLIMFDTYYFKFNGPLKDNELMQTLLTKLKLQENQFYHTIVTERINKYLYKRVTPRAISVEEEGFLQQYFPNAWVFITGTKSKRFASYFFSSRGKNMMPKYEIF